MSNPSTPTSIYERTSIRYWLLFAVVGAVAAAAITFCGINFFATRDLGQMAKAPNGELDWLRREFYLKDAQFSKNAKLQSTYTPVLDDTCANSTVSTRQRCQCEYIISRRTYD